MPILGDKKISSAIQTLLASFSINFANLATGVLSARILLPEGRGELASVLLWGTILAAAAIVGLDQAAIYFLSKANDQDRRSLAIKILNLTIVCSSSIACLTAFFIFVSGGLKGATSLEIRFLPALYVVVNNLTIVLVAALLAVGLPKFWNITRASVHYFSLLIMAFVFLIGWQTPVAAAWAMLMANVLTALLAFGFCRRLFSSDSQSQIARVPTRNILKYSVGVQGTALYRLLSERLDQLAVTLFFGARELGLYVVGVVLVRAISGVLSPLEQILFRRLVTRGDEEHASFGLSTLLILGVFLTFIFSAVFGLVSPFFVHILFGQEFGDSIRILQISLFSLPPLVGRLVIGSYLKSSGRPAYASSMELVMLTSLFFATLALRGYGVDGIAVSVLVSSWIALIFGLILAFKILGAIRFSCIPSELEALTGSRRLM